MSAHPAESGRPPEVDEGNPHDLASWLVAELRPTPGRLGDALRIVAALLVVVTIGEVFRLPDIALSAFIVLFLSGREAVSTVLTALISGIAAVSAVFATIAVFLLSLSEPAVRIPLMAVLTFLTMFLSQASPLGPVFFAAGFIVAYGLTLGDEVLGLALQPATAGNTEQLTLPEIFFMPPPEALLRALLWLSLAVVFPVSVLVVANLLTGRDPALLLRAALAERLASAAGFCAGKKAAERRLEAQAFEGTATLRKLHHLAGFLRRDRHHPLWDASLIDAISRLGLLLLAWFRIEGDARNPLVHAASFCRAAEHAVRDGEAPIGDPIAIDATGAARPLANAISRTLDAIREELAATPDTPARKEKATGPSTRRFLAADAFSNPAHVRFALKVTLAVMICYFAENLADWPGIHTCVITSFFVALGTVGETLHKATLRFAGCLIGAGLGLGAILLLMPGMTDLGDLLLLLAPVTLLAAWVAHGSERIAYAGLQIGIAFYLVVLQGYGPTIDMQTARDRVIGILFGNIVIFAIFTTIWPVSVTDVVRTNLAKALQQLASILDSDLQAEGVVSPVSRSPAAMAFGQAIVHARTVLVNDPFETQTVRRASGRRPIDATVVAQIGWLLIPIGEIVELRADAAWRELPPLMRDMISAYHRKVAAWFDQTASWVRSGAAADQVLGGPPEPPSLSGANDELLALATWHRLLHDDIRNILDEVAPRPQPVRAVEVGEALRAAR
jgi:multidrug resistance protein MdtO